MIWKIVGVYLDFDWDELQNMEQGGRGTIEDVVFDMLIAWRNKSSHEPKAKKEELERALKSGEVGEWTDIQIGKYKDLNARVHAYSIIS